MIFRRYLQLISMLLAVLSSGNAVAGSSTEYDIKAAFLYNFAKFVQWKIGDSDHENMLHICILGEDPFGESLDALAGKQAQGKTLKIRRLGDIGERTNCEMLFISSSQATRLKSVLDTIAKEQGLLSISDIDDFASSGGIIELQLVDNKIRFIVNMASAKEANISLSSKLLRLGQIINGE